MPAYIKTGRKINNLQLTLQIKYSSLLLQSLNRGIIQVRKEIK